VLKQEGSRLHDPAFPELGALGNQRISVSPRVSNIFAPREDPTSPRWVQNQLDASGYVGQAACPPGSGTKATFASIDKIDDIVG
jgi:hypothetical protein